MTFPHKVFLDSDVVISALLSDHGASGWLIRDANIQKWVSNLSQKEIKMVAKRLNITDEKSRLTLKLPSVVALNNDLDKIKEKFGSYVDDSNDAHVVAGAVAAGAGYLATYNLRHFRVDKIRSDFGVVVMTPGLFLQYLRSIAVAAKS